MQHNTSFSVDMGGGTTVYYCSLSKSGGSGINYSVLGGSVVTSGGSSSLGVSDSLSGTDIELTLKQL